MQSEAVNPSQPLSPQDQAALASIKPTGREIAGSLQPGESPLDFIKRNLRPTTPPVAAVVPDQVVAQVEQKRAEALVPPEPIAPSPEVKPEIPPEVKDDNKIAASVPATPVSDELPGDAESELTDKDSNFKALRKKAAETASALKAKEKEVEDAQKKVKQYETGAVVPDVIKGYEKRIGELEKYEKIVALKTSPAYKEKFIKPIDNIKVKLGEIAADYGMPKELVAEALTMTNKRDLNSFLSEHFDPAGMLEVKQLISEAQDIGLKAKEAESEPAKALAAIEDDFKNIEAHRKEREVSSIIENSKSSWVDSLTAIKEEGKIPELILRENDPEHNAKYVEPVLQAAGTEYGKLVKVLAENGLKSLPKDVGYALAHMVQLAFGSSLAERARAKAEEEAAQIRASADRTTRYTRPPIGGGTGHGLGTEAPVPSSPRDAANQILAKVMGKR